MTTAPDLPLPDLPLPVGAPTLPAQVEPERPPLALVPAVPAQPASGEEIVDFDEALRTATPRMVRYATRRLGDPHEAEEVVQEALLRAFQHRSTLTTEDDLMAWLTVVTGRLVIDRLRVRGRMTPVAELPPGGRTGRDTADVVVARDEARIALDALEAMPARQAAVLWAREVEGLSYDDISDRFGLSEPTVRSLLHRARKTLRREYAVRGGTLPTMGLVALAPWLRGLRWAGKIRAAARKGGAVAVTAATGLAVATVAPLWSHSAPSTPDTASLPAYVAKAHTTGLVTSHVPAAVTKAPAARPAAPTVHAAAPARQSVLTLLPQACTRSGVGAGCASRPTKSTLYLQLNHKDIGISSSLVPVDCTTLPATPVTHCQPSKGKN